MCDQQQFLCVVVIICKNLPSSPSLLGAGGSRTDGGGGAERPRAGGGRVGGGNVGGGSVGGGSVGGGSVVAGGMPRRQSSSMDTTSSWLRSAISAKELYY